MLSSAGIVLAGGRSTRMGASKASLEWHGSTLLRRVAGIVARGTGGGPLIVVRSPGQVLPALPGAVEVVEDARKDRGPLQGMAAGLAAVDGRAEAAFVCATDVPLLHPVFVRRVLGALGEGDDAAVPSVNGRRHPLCAAYRVWVRPVVEELVAAARLRQGLLLERCRARSLSAAELLADRALHAADPRLDSVRNLNQPADYRDARALPAPTVCVEHLDDGEAGVTAAPAATLAQAALAASVRLGDRVAVVLNGDRVAADPELPLVAGDRLRFSRG